MSELQEASDLSNSVAISPGAFEQSPFGARTIPERPDP